MTLARLLAFLGVFTTVLGLVHLYVWFRVVRGAALPSPWGRILTLAMIALLLAIPGLFLLRDGWPRSVLSPVSWVVYSWMGFLFYLFVFSLLSDLGRGAAGVLGLLPHDAERRTFLGRLIAGGVAGAALLTGVAGMAHARGFRVKSVTVPLAKLPAEGSGYVIAQITDLHVGPLIGREYVGSVVRETNAVGADMIVITGDLVDGSVEALREHVAPLAELKARDGVFFVTGNHEYYAGADAWIAHLESLGIRVLRNRRVDIRGLFDLAGVDDTKAKGMAPGHGEDIPGALAGRDPARAVVLLAHQPKAVHEAAAAGVDLQISGHVHGGQMVPFNWLVHLDQPFLDGLHRVRDTWIYVSPGTGYWGPPMRVGTTSEIARIELVSA